MNLDLWVPGGSLVSEKALAGEFTCLGIEEQVLVSYWCTRNLIFYCPRHLSLVSEGTFDWRHSMEYKSSRHIHMNFSRH